MFKATHRYNGEDVGVFNFKRGEEVKFVRTCNEGELGSLTEENGVYVNADGDEQYVRYACMEAI